MAATRVFSSSVSSEFIAAWDRSLPAALPPPGPDPVGDGSVLWILRCSSLEQFSAGGETGFRTGVLHQITRVGSCQAPSRGLCFSKLGYCFLFTAQQKFPPPEGLFSLSVMLSIPCLVPFPQINFWAGSWASPLVPFLSFRFLSVRPSTIGNLKLLTGNISIRISEKCLRREDAWQLFDKIHKKEWTSRSGSQESRRAKQPPAVVLPLLSPAENMECIHGVAADEKPTSYEASTVGISGASPPLFPLRQTKERKTLHNSSSLWSQICRGKQNPGHSASFQILIKLISGKTLLQWVRASDPVQNLKQALEIKLGIPSAAQRLLHAGMTICELCKKEITCRRRSRNGSTCTCSTPNPCNSEQPNTKYCCCQICYSNLRKRAWWYHKQTTRLTDEEMHLNRLIASQEVNLRTLINKNQSLTSATKNSTEENESLKSALKSLEARIQFLTMWDSVPGYDSSADVVLLTPDGGRFIAHSSILSGRSIVFKAMLNSGMQESRSMVIRLEDVNKEAVAIFLKFLYKAQIDAKDFQENGEVKAEMIIRLCQQYQIDFLLSTFQNFIVENIINIENLETILCIADIYELDVVKTAITQDSRWSALHAVECTYSSCISIN